MNNDMTSYLQSQLPYVGPLLLAYLVGIIVSAVQIRSVGKAAGLALAGCGTLFLITAVFPFIQGYLFTSRAAQNWSSSQYASKLMIAGVLRNVLYIAAFGVLLGAVFTGRRRAWTPGFDVDMNPRGGGGGGGGPPMPPPQRY